MVQPSNRFCANCGTALESGQRFCPNCGSAVDAAVSDPTARSTPEEEVGTVPIAQPPALKSGIDHNAPTTELSSAPEGGASLTPPPPPGQQPIEMLTPPPPPDPYPSAYPPSSASYPGVSYSTGQPAAGGYMPVPDFARPQKSKNRVGVIAAVLIAVLVIGGGVFLATRVFGGGGTLTDSQRTATAIAHKNTTPAPEATTQETATSQETPTPGTSGQPKQVTFKQPLTFTYKSVDISILSVQQAMKFDDDTDYYSDNNPGILRLNIKENNSGSSSALYYPTSSMLIVQPDGTTVKAQQAHEEGSVDAGVNRQNWVDFPVALSTDVSKLILRVGDSDEAQIEVPLKEGADLSKYQSKTVDVNKTVTYGNLKWTVTSATASLSYKGNQAKKGQVYISLKFKVENSSSNPAISSPYDYLRLKSGDSVTTVKDINDVPVSFEAGSNTECSAAFLVPASADGGYTLQLLGKNDSYWSKDQANIDFSVK